MVGALGRMFPPSMSVSMRTWKEQYVNAKLMTMSMHVAAVASLGCVVSY